MRVSAISSGLAVTLTIFERANRQAVLRSSIVAVAHVGEELAPILGLPCRGALAVNCD